MVALAVLAGLPAARAERTDSAPAPARERTGDQRVVTITVASGDTLAGLLRDPDRHILNRQAVIGAVLDVFDPRRLQPGDQIRLVVRQTGDGAVVRSIHFETGRESDQTVDILDNDEHVDGSADSQLSVHRATGTVGSSFRRTLARQNVPADLVDEVLTAFEFDPDMPAPPPARGKFAIVYETVSARGVPDQSQLRTVALDDGRRMHRVYRYQLADGDPAYVRDDGKGIALVDLGAPIADERVTSPFGWRTHPVFGDRRFHEGVDFGAPLGTAVVAAADGRVADAGWRGNYGIYVRLDHGGGIATAYAHLSRLARGVVAGHRFRKGETIGYVGRTGVATGPHLYYEVLVGDRRIDPLNVPRSVPIRLEGRHLAAFRQFVQETRSEAAAVK